MPKKDIYKAILRELQEEWAERRRQDKPRIRVCPAHVRKIGSMPCTTCVGTVCAKRAALGLDDDGRPLPVSQRPDCAAMTRRGAICRNKVIPGKRRCKFHGGLSTGPRTEAGRARIAEAQRQRWRNWRGD